MVDPNQHDQFVLRQKWTLVINRYFFSLPGEEDRPFCFVEQQRFKFKEDIRFFTDDTKSVELMRIKARQAFDPTATYDVTMAGGERIGQIQKVFGMSLLRSTYRIYDARGNEIATAEERSLPVAIFRRVTQFIPLIGDVADWLPIPYDFVFKRGEQLLGHNRRRRFKVADTYDIDLSEDTARTLDRRLVLALAVGMDALQAR
jgi:uncharacterized protein YxjI